LSRDYFLRFDLTENKQYTLSKATRDILKDLEEPILITAYFSQNLPEQYQKIRRDFQEMLFEYATLSRGMLDYEFISPNDEPEKEQAALQNGIQPLLINVREKDQVKQQKAYMGAVLQMGDRKELIPFVQPGGPMEYNLSTSIKKLSVVDKPSVGLVQGHGEPGLSELERMYNSLSILYNVENVDLSQEESVPDRFRAIALINPQDTLPPDHLAKLDNYLAGGGKMVVAINRVKGDLSTAQGTVFDTGLEKWLSDKGLQVKPEFVVDAQCGSVTVQQRQGFFTFNSQVQFPFLPLVSSFVEHPVTKGLEQVVFPFASPVEYTGDRPGLVFTPLVRSSSKGGTVSPPIYFDVNKKWNAADFPEGNLVLGGILEGDINGSGSASSLIVFGDGDFPANSNAPDNVNLIVNAIDWLSDDTGLIDLRTKEVTSRPLESEIMAEEAAGTRQTIKLANFLIPLVLVLGYGIYRSQLRRNKRIRRMQEDYS
jgi:gliding-associated putative ABC transporter substrate-binding component GldG